MSNQPIQYQDLMNGFGLYMTHASYRSNSGRPVLVGLEIRKADGLPLARNVQHVGPGGSCTLTCQAMVKDEQGATAQLYVREVPIAWPHRNLMDYAEFLGLRFKGNTPPPEFDWDDWDEDYD